MNRREALKKMTFGAGGPLLCGKPIQGQIAKIKITQVSVMAARTFNHPYESYSNFRPSVTMTAELQEGQKADEILFALQQNAERIVENHKQRILHECEDTREEKESPTDESFWL